MNFFESQDIAKRNTGRLIFLFVLAVISLVVITNVLVLALFRYFPTDSMSYARPPMAFDWQQVLVVSVAVIFVILLGSLYKLAALAGGGARVAEMLDGRLLLPETGDMQERRLLNVVEEMALASGTPVPPVYLLEESGINAFAAGYTPGDAVIGITRGAIETLNRDELQGVIAHEFSHILHGDMRINIRLIAVLHGILILGIVGYHLMRGGAYSRRSRGSGGIVALGLGLIVVGYVGTFFGNLIKAAVSRQREFLADASAVQYTRNPQGIAGALMQIATHSQRSYLANPSSIEISHALFEEAGFSRLRSLYATHPPLEDRIRAILPGWDGEMAPAQNRPEPDSSPKDTGLEDAEQADRQSAKLLALITGAAMIDRIGQPGSAQLVKARQLLAEIPDKFLVAAHQPSSARAIVYLLAIAADPELRRRQLEFVDKSADTGVAEELQQLLENAGLVEVEFRLALLSIALNSLRQLSESQYRLFRSNLQQLVRADSRLSLFEWALVKIVVGSLDPVFDKQGPRPIGRKELKNCTVSLESLFSLLAYADLDSELDPAEAFAQARDKIGYSDLKILEKSALDFTLLENALKELAEVKPLQKPALLKACVACITADNKIAPIEVELLRALGAVLQCPIPPLDV